MGYSNKFLASTRKHVRLELRLTGHLGKESADWAVKVPNLRKYRGQRATTQFAQLEMYEENTMNLKNKLTIAVAAASLCSQAALACPNMAVDRQMTTLTLEDATDPYFNTLLAVADNSIAISVTSDTGQRSYSSAHLNPGEVSSWYIRLDTFHSATDIMAQCPETPGVISGEIGAISYIRPNDTEEYVLWYMPRKKSMGLWTRINGDGHKWNVYCTAIFEYEDYLAKLAELQGNVALNPGVAGSAGTDICFEQVINGPGEGDARTSRAHDDIDCNGLAQTACHEVKIDFEATRQSVNVTPISEPTAVPTIEPAPGAGEDGTAQFFGQLQTISQGRPAKSTLQGLRTLLTSSDANRIVASRSTESSTIRVLRRQVTKLLRVRDNARIRSGLTRILSTLRQRN